MKSRYHFRVEFGRLQRNGLRVLPDGRSPRADVQVYASNLESAEKKAVLVAMSAFRNDSMVLYSDYDARGYAMERREGSWT